MPKPISERQTTNPLGLKLNRVLAEKGMPGDYAALASIFGVKTPSVYDWVVHGRLGKERYAKLVEWSGRGLDWWFDVPTPPAQAGHMAADRPAPAYLPAPPQQQPPLQSPFGRISAEDWAALPPEVLAEIETYALGIIAGHRLLSDRKRANGGPA